MTDLALVFGSLAVVAGVGVLGWSLLGGRRHASVDLGGEHGQQPIGSDTVDLRDRALTKPVSERSLMPAMHALGQWLGERTPAGWLRRIRHRLLQAGAPPAWTAERVLALTVLSTIGLGALGIALAVVQPSPASALLAVLLVIVPLLGPSAVLAHRAEQRQAVIRAGLSDAIDQLAVTVRAGLGLDAAIARLARSADGPLFDELTRVMQDIRTGATRSAALSAMAERVDLPELHHFSAALVQADRLGVPVAKALEVQANELRIRHRQRLEEEAMKLPVKILFPTAVCILPTLLIIILGPAAISIYESLTG